MLLSCICIVGFLVCPSLIRTWLRLAPWHIGEVGLPDSTVADAGDALGRRRRVWRAVHCSLAHARWRWVEHVSVSFVAILLGSSASLLSSPCWATCRRVGISVVLSVQNYMMVAFGSALGWLLCRGLRDPLPEFRGLLLRLSVRAGMHVNWCPQ